MEFPSSSAGTRVPASEFAGWWFMVPAKTETLWVRLPSRLRSRRVTVWNPQGERAWDGCLADSPQEIKIAVPAWQAGQLWLATGSGFELDPTIPPDFSVSRGKWFHPDAEQ